MKSSNREPLLEIFIFETQQLLEQLENCILECEKKKDIYSSIGEIFRIMHTLKGSSAMMFFDNITHITHKNEDLFFYIRENKIKDFDYVEISDIVLEVIDFVKNELGKIDNNTDPDGNPQIIISKIECFQDELQIKHGKKTTGPKLVDEETQKYYISSYSSDSSTGEINKFEVSITFVDDCQLENVRAFTIIHNIKEHVSDLESIPDNPLDNDNSIEIIKESGFKMLLSTDLEKKSLNELFEEFVFIKNIVIESVDSNKTYKISDTKVLQNPAPKLTISENINTPEPSKEEVSHKVESPKFKSNEDINENASSNDQVVTESRTNFKQSIISVNVKKLDQLMDIVGELVICESFVLQNPDLKDLNLENFDKAARQLQKITGELQDTVMSIRLVPIEATFQKMHRIVRDMSKKLKKEIELECIGEDTEVDKNIIEHIADPLMHLIRNSLDHGIESPEERTAKGKSPKGKLTLEAKNSGGDVLIIIKDDGKGLDTSKLLSKGLELGLVDSDKESLTDKEIFSLIFKPGFSTKDEVSEFSGRGVGMDVVTKNIKKVRGSISIDSTLDKGTTITIKIPLTLAIVDGMVIQVGNSTYTLPITSIKESFKVANESIVDYDNGKEILVIRGKSLPVLRLSNMFNVRSDITDIKDGIIIIIENEFASACIFADALIGEQQVVLKTLPNYVKKTPEVAGCTLLGNGDISLVLDVESLLKH